MAISIALAGAAVISAGTAIYTSSKASDASDEQMAQQKAQQDKSLANENQAKATADADAQRSIGNLNTIYGGGMSNSGRSGTILTSPLGVVGNGNQNTSKQTLGE